MEYTKDMIFGIRYDEVSNTIKSVNQKRTSKILQTLKKHKVMTATVFSAIVFISIDVVLVTNFFRILTML